MPLFHLSHNTAPPPLPPKPEELGGRGGTPAVEIRGKTLANPSNTAGVQSHKTITDSLIFRYSLIQIKQGPPLLRINGTTET